MNDQCVTLKFLAEELQIDKVQLTQVRSGSRDCAIGSPYLG